MSDVLPLPSAEPRLSGDARPSRPAPDARLAYWRDHLAGAPAALELPADRPRPASPSGRQAEHGFPVPRATTGALRTLAEREGATPSVALLAAFNVLLSRWSGQDDVVVGFRERPVGDEPLPLRADLSGDPSFRALLARVRKAVLDAQAHGGVPLDRIVDALGVERDPGRAPLFQALFVGAETETLDFGSDPAAFDLVLAMREDTDGPHATLRYATDLFDAETIGRMAQHLCVLLGGIVADPERPVFALPLLSDAERARIATWESEPLADPAPQPFPVRFSAQVRRAPDATAVRFGDTAVSYRELDARSSRLANHLRRLGIGPESRVGVCLERTPDLLVALLGVLKAGAAYVPLEPHFPPDRITSVLGDARASLLVTRAHRTRGLGLPCPVLRVDDAAVR
ncbi:MAG TPA: condensation domain-containing protein, partial [Longimicrobium sp.]|nr:condensation domain-containing protein [Longimicrobium sp.]